MIKKTIIIGGVAGGATAAARLRRLDESMEIIILEKDGYISFANCGLPYHVSGEIAQRGALILQTPEDMRIRFRIDVRIFNECVAVDTDQKLVRIKSADKGEYEEGYDALILCPGAQPIMLPVDEDIKDSVFTLRNIPDLDAITTKLEEASKSAAVIGGGFVGLEMAENLIKKGVQVQLAEALPQVLPPLDADMAKPIAMELQKNGVQLYLGDGVSAIQKGEKGVCVTLASGVRLEAGIVICAVGVRPATQFLRQTGIALTERGHIIVNEHMQTNIPDVYAAGDAVQVMDAVLGVPAAVPLAGPANKQARIAADNIAGFNHTYGGVLGTAVVQAFGLTAACTGANEKTLIQRDIPYLKAITHPMSHAGYYPGARQLTAKLLFNKAGKILGAQLIGGEGVEKRIDVIATAMRLGANVTQLGELELCYAPPYSSAKDPVNMLGFVAENMLNGVTEMADWAQTLQTDTAHSQILDVRTKREYDIGHVKDAVHIPVDELRERLHELDREKNLLVYCHVGVRAHTACRILAQNGFKVKNITGGYLSYPGEKAF